MAVALAGCRAERGTLPLKHVQLCGKHKKPKVENVPTHHIFNKYSKKLQE